MFFHFGQKFQNGRHMWGGENFFKIAKSTFLTYPWVENFDEITLSRTVKEIEAILCLPFWAKIRKFKMATICGKRKFFENCQEYIAQIPCGLKILTKSLYLTWLRR